MKTVVKIKASRRIKARGIAALLRLAPRDMSTGTVGGIDRGRNCFWRNHAPTVSP